MNNVGSGAKNDGKSDDKNLLNANKIGKIEEKKSRRRGRAVTQTDTIDDKNRPQSANPRTGGRGKTR